MKETIEYLKKDRKVNDTFMKKLQKVGFEIDYMVLCQDLVQIKMRGSAS